jgi:hypothetical protein
VDADAGCGCGGLCGIAAAVHLGLFQISLSFILYARAIRRLRAVESVLVLTLEPILNPVWVLLVLGERPDAMAVAGGAVVVGAVLGRALFGALAADGAPRLDSGAASVSHGPGSIRFRVPVGTRKCP